MTRAVPDTDQIDQDYVRDILAALPRGLEQCEFNDRTRLDRNAGWGPEVDEAWRRYRAERIAT